MGGPIVSITTWCVAIYVRSTGGATPNRAGLAGARPLMQTERRALVVATELEAAEARLRIRVALDVHLLDAATELKNATSRAIRYFLVDPPVTAAALSRPPMNSPTAA